jgi:exonuclease SbcC
MAEISYAVKMHKIDMVMHTGDLFHTSKVSNKFMGQVAEIIKSYGVPMYIIPGNHDIDGYTIDTIDQTSLGLLAKTGVVKLLTRDNPLRLNVNENGSNYVVAISGQEYYAGIDTGNMEDFEMQQAEADINILGVHGYVTDTPQHPDIRATLIKDIITDADIVLSGHYHRRFSVDYGDVSFYNPGSALRVDMTDYNKNNMPQYGVLDISYDKGTILYDYKFHNFRVAQPGATVFDFNAKYKTQQSSVTLENFKTSIANTMQNVSPSVSFLTVIHDVCVATPHSNYTEQDIENAAIQFYNTAVTGAGKEFVIDAGYIPSNTYKSIASVEIHNFQSHADTVAVFSPGLNIIVGESNNGKTSIFRAIKWVTDNTPLGNDFIMTGQNECWVKITYSDGSFIQRYRTVKDSGYYNIHYFDDTTGQWEDRQYQGFTNNIPIEVANVHQMPKVFVTKDIETHLNMMDQLEGPFLVTESQAQKAAAIGRITGTNIVDDAIKECSQEIMNLKRDNKKKATDIIDIESKLSMLPSVSTIDRYTKYISAITKSGEELANFLGNLNFLSLEKQNIETSLQNSQDKINNLRNVLDIKLDVEEAEELSSKITTLIDIKQAYEAEVALIADYNNTINKCKNVLSCKDKIAEAEGCITNINKVLPIRKEYNNTVDITGQLSVKIDVNSRAGVLYKSIVKYAMDLKDKTEKMVTMNDSYETLKHLSMELSQTMEECATQKQINQDILHDTQEQLTSYILSQGKCPYCGQEITEGHVDNIIGSLSSEGGL